MTRPAPVTDSLTPDAIAVAALAILDDEGADALSFRRLATVLGVSHTTVHRHCGSVAGLLDLCVDQLATQLPAPDPALPWADATERTFTALYDLLNAHPALVVLRRDRPWTGERVLARLVEPTLQANLGHGLTPEQAIRAYRQLYLFTLGCSAFVDHSEAAQAARRVRTALAGLDPAQFPALTRDVELVVHGMGDRAVFVEGLRSLVAAADAHVRTPATTTR